MNAGAIFLMATTTRAVMPRFKRGIQYPAVCGINPNRRGVLDRPAEPGDDTPGFWAGLQNKNRNEGPANG